MEKEIEQTTTTAATTKMTDYESIMESDPKPDMTEKWEIMDGGEDWALGTPIECDAYGFINESGYQFACEVFLPKGAKDGDRCPIVIMNNGLQTTWITIGNVQLKPGAVPDENGDYKPEDMEISGWVTI